MYEIMKFPALDRDYRNLVILPPRYLTRPACDIIQQGESQRLWRSLLDIWNNGSSSGDTDLVFHGARERVRVRGILETMIHNNEGLANDLDDVDWVGEIVALGLDGSITVRLSGAATCRDEVISDDRVLAVIDLDNLPAGDEHEDDDGSVDLDMEDASNASTISESIEYEGGERIDNDTDDENWESAEEDLAKMDDDVDMTDAPETQGPSTDPLVAPQNIQPPPRSSIPPAEKPSFYSVLTHLSDTAPPSFAILDIPPPADQHRPSIFEPPSSSTFLKRIKYEHKILSSSLPPSIYVRAYESNLSLLRCLIIGPEDTPYEHAPFVIDLALTAKYPIEPPIAHFHSWTSGLGRINPNLYEEGKICLSLLGTWPGKASKEQWSKDATILQLLVSLQGLVMVKKPFYNEAGFEEYANEKGYENESAQYSEKAYVMARGFVKHAIIRPPRGIEDVLAWNYFRPYGDMGLSQEVMDRGRQLINASMEVRKQQPTSQDDGQELLLDGAGHTSSESFLRPLSRGAMVMLNRLLNELVECWEIGKQAIVDDINSIDPGLEGLDANGPDTERAFALAAARESLRRRRVEEEVEGEERKCADVGVDVDVEGER